MRMVQVIVLWAIIFISLQFRWSLVWLWFQLAQIVAQSGELYKKRGIIIIQIMLEIMKIVRNVESVLGKILRISNGEWKMEGTLRFAGKLCIFVLFNENFFVGKGFMVLLSFLFSRNLIYFCWGSLQSSLLKYSRTYSLRRFTKALHMLCLTHSQSFFHHTAFHSRYFWNFSTYSPIFLCLH